jgi:hypothetical protein
MDPEPVPARARRLRNPLRRLAVAGIAGVAWLALSATTATADDAAGSPSLPAGAGDVATLSSVPDDKLGATQAPTTTGLGDLAPENHVWAADAVPEPTLPATDPGLSAQAPVPAVPEPGVPVPDPTPPAADPGAPVPDPTPSAADPTPPALDPAAPVPEPTPPAADPAAPVPEPTPPAADPAAPVPDPGVALPVVTPVGPLPGSTVPMPDPPCPGSVGAPAGSTVAAPEDAGSPTAAGIVNEAVLQPLASHPQAKSRLGYLGSASFPPPGSAANVTSGKPLRGGVPGSGAADPAAPSAPDGGGAPAPSGPVGPSPWHEGTGLPAPNALPGAPGSGSGSGHSPTSPAGTAAWIPSLYFYLPTMDADPIRGPLQHEYSAVCADLGSSPD